MWNITIATASMIHPTFEECEKRYDSPEPLLEEAEKNIIEASKQGCDFLCLPELFASLNRSQPLGETAEVFDGPVASFLSTMASRYSIVLITSVLIKEEEDYKECEGSTNIPMAFSSNSEKITLLQLDGKIQTKRLKEAIEAAKKACKKVYELQKKTLKEVGK